MKSLLLALSLLACSAIVCAQEKPPKLDTLLVPQGYLLILDDTSFVVTKDTLVIGPRVRMKEDPYSKAEKFYDSLQQKAERMRVTRELHELLIRQRSHARTVDSAIIKSEEAFRAFSGKTIRSIRIKKIDLIEGSVLDTAMFATSRVGKFVNRVHADTRDFIIRNNLLFKVGDMVDPYKLADNERILRQFRTIRDARIYMKEAEDSHDEVDVVVVTQDVASVGAAGGYSSLDKFNLDVYDINILGYAKQLQVSYYRNTKGTPQNGFEVLLRTPNFGRSFIQGEVRYTDTYLRNRLSAFAGRDFLTPRMKYAGAAEVFKTKENYVFDRNDTLPQPYTQEGIDVWLGRSFQLDTRTNFIVALRTNNHRFTSRPVISRDSNFFFYNRNHYLVGLNIFHTNYIKGSLIQGFGRTEDVPVNAWLSVTFGPEYNTFARRNYIDVHAGMGRYYARAGYFYTDVTLGGFRTGERSWEDGILTINSNYFSNLMPAGKTKVRQFVNFSYVHGYRRTVSQTIAINRGWRDGIGFVPLGNERLTFGLETVYFTPWYYYGFKFALYHGAEFNFLSEDEKLLDKGHVFPSVKAGIRMLNDNLVFPTISIDVNYYIRTANYKPSFAINLSTNLPRLFGSPQSFRPQIAEFR